MAFGDIVQTKTLSGGSGTGDSATLIFDTEPTEGNLVVICCGIGLADSVRTLSIPASMAEAFANSGLSSQATQQRTAYLVYGSGDSNSFLFDFTGTGTDPKYSLVGVEIEGPFDATPLDKTATDLHTSADTGPHPTGTTDTTVQADEIAVAAWAFQSAPDATSYSDSFVERDTEVTSGPGNDVSVNVATRLLTATGTYGSDATSTSNRRSWNGVATFRSGSAGGVSVELAVATASLAAQALTPQAAAATVTLAPSAVTLAAQALSPTAAPTETTLVPAVATGSAQAFEPSLVAASVDLVPATAAVTGQAVTPTAAPTEIPLAPASAIISAQTIQPTAAAAEIELAPAAVVSTAQALSPSAGGVVVALTAAAAAITASPIVVQVEATSVELVLANATVAGSSLSPSTGGANVTLTAAVATITASPVVVQVEATSVEITPASVTAGAQALTPDHASAVVTLEAAQTTITAQPLTLVAPVFGRRQVVSVQMRRTVAGSFSAQVVRSSIDKTMEA